MIDRERRELSTKEIKYSIPIRKELVDILCGIVSFAFAALSIWSSCGRDINAAVVTPVVVALVLSNVVLIVIQLFYHARSKRKSEDYEYYVASERISNALLASLKRINFEKTSYILRSTYGRVPEWHPINYEKNVLVYDVHEHLRKICVSLKDLIVSLSPDYNDDKVTVDMVCCYPSDCDLKGKAGRECKTKGTSDSENNGTNKDSDNSQAYEWRLISSGDHTTPDKKIHELLKANKSFYNYILPIGYAFCNEKTSLVWSGHYIISNKDKLYNKRGSVVGLVIDLKNDQPEKVFVKVILTITTYGRNLVEKTDHISVDEFEEIFKENVLNCYKTLIESELAQMFIRHGIMEEYIDPTTGGFISKDDGLSKIMNEIDEVVDAL